MGEGNSWEGGGVGDTLVGYVDSPRSQVVALLLTHRSAPLLFLLASPCSLLPHPNPFPCGNVPMSWPHSTPAGKADRHHKAPPHSLSPHHPGEHVTPLISSCLPALQAPALGRFRGLDPGTWVPPALVLVQRVLPWPEPAPLCSYPALPYLARQTHPCHRHLLKAELSSQHGGKE